MVPRHKQVCGMNVGIMEGVFSAPGDKPRLLPGGS